MQPLTARELQIARLVARGYSNHEVGTTLQISTQTVKNHLQSIFRKLALENRVELTIHVTQRRTRTGRKTLNRRTA
ncbi:MAG: response regulator transcription factor [Acidobacteria bacterium]|nr:response regulator transcription factor [Acidobacteriota bacterium]MBV9145475.1 response regulator transcription factor [Acidobacteriota bacterium]MBV9437864.1 response regulator transcription factor [Acidobacteriota bacterium]